MCDYSLHHVGSRPAKVNDKLVTTELARSRNRGFAAVGELGAKLVIDEAPPKVAVCLMPGTELAFDDYIQHDRVFSVLGSTRTRQKLARFRQIDGDDPHVHHDALEFSDGQVVKVTRLVVGQTARVLQLPVGAPHSELHHEHAGHAAPPSESRLALNRVLVKPGLASILVPSQNTVMLWRTCRSTAVRLSIALEQALRRLKSYRQRMIPAASPMGADVAQIMANFKKGTVREASPKLPEGRTPEKIKAKPVA